MNGQTYIIYTKFGNAGNQSIKIKATGYSTTTDKQLIFEDKGTRIAVFNMSEVGGFIQEDHIVD